MHAIIFDLDPAALPPGVTYCYASLLIQQALLARGFTHQAGSLYFGDAVIDAVACVLVAMDLARAYPWFAPAVKEMRMLRVEENSDLLPAVARSN